MHKELFERLNEHFLMAEAFHRESELAFYYLALPGFSELHRFQYLDESKTHCDVMKYAIDKWGLVLPAVGGSDARVLAPTAKSVDGVDSDAKTKQGAIEKLWKWYHDWEVDSLVEYTDVATKLREDGHIAAAIFVEHIVEDVDQELIELDHIMHELEGMDYDMPTITSMQEDLKTEYQKKIHKLF